MVAFIWAGRWAWIRTVARARAPTERALSSRWTTANATVVARQLLARCVRVYTIRALPDFRRTTTPLAKALRHPSFSLEDNDGVSRPAFSRRGAGVIFICLFFLNSTQATILCLKISIQSRDETIRLFQIHIMVQVLGYISVKKFVRNINFTVKKNINYTMYDLASCK